MESYVRSQITIAPNQSISIDFTAGRGPNGLTATLDIRAAAPAAPAKPKSDGYRGGPRQAMPAAAVKGTDPAEVTPSEPEPEMTAEEAADAIPDQETPEQEAAREDAAAEETADEPEAEEPKPTPKVNPFAKAKAVTSDAEADAPAEAAPKKPASSIFSKAS